MSLRHLLRSRVGLALALAADFFLWGGPHRPHEAFPVGFHDAVRAQAAVNRDWLDLEGVVGTAVAMDAGGNHVVKVYLASPGVVLLPARMGEVDVVTEVTGPFLAGDAATAPTASDREVDRKAAFPRPVPIGVSAGHGEITAGTIGARVTDGRRVLALSNNHVFAASNAGHAGDAVLQPGAADGGRAGDEVASLTDYEPIVMCRVGICIPNAMDAAVAVTTAGDVGRATPEDGYGTPRSVAAEAEIGMKVQKYGRTTGHTKGRVSGIHATVDVSYRDGSARFRDQIVVSGAGGFSGPGDSGSLIVTDGVLAGDRRPVALLFAGSSTTTLANPIGPVLERFGVTIDGERTLFGGREP